LTRPALPWEKGFIKVNEYLETSVAGIYAIGDAIGNYMLAHVATSEGGNRGSEAYSGKSTR